MESLWTRRHFVGRGKPRFDQSGSARKVDGSIEGSQAWPSDYDTTLWALVSMAASEKGFRSLGAWEKRTAPFLEVGGWCLGRANGWRQISSHGTALSIRSFGSEYDAEEEEPMASSYRPVYVWCKGPSVTKGLQTHCIGCEWLWVGSTAGKLAKVQPPARGTWTDQGPRQSWASNDEEIYTGREMA